MKVAIYSRHPKKALLPKYKKLLDRLRKNKIELCFFKKLYDYLDNMNMVEEKDTCFLTPADLSKSTNCMLSLGGDGTFLEASQYVLDLGLAILGINFGRLGFLAQVSAEDIDSAIDELSCGNYSIEKRAIIETTGDIDYPRALNEVAIQRNNASMIQTTVKINGEPLASYWSDGLLVSTPTGSTAYSLSVGGPVVLPSTDTLIVTPISPHNLSIRPAIIPGDSIIDIEIITRMGKAQLSMDTSVFNIKSKTKIQVKKSNVYLNFIKLKNYSFYNTLQTRLHWGTDIRN